MAYYNAKAKVLVDNGKTTKKVIKDAVRDKWFSASEALDYGIIDEIVTTRK